MGRLDDMHDQPHSERGDPDYKVGFKGFDWWTSWTHWALPLFISVGEAYGPMGYENGYWVMKNIHVQFFFIGCNVDFITKWVPHDESDPIPRRRPADARPRRKRAVRREIDDSINGL